MPDRRTVLPRNFAEYNWAGFPKQSPSPAKNMLFRSLHINLQDPWGREALSQPIQRDGRHILDLPDATGSRWRSIPVQTVRRPAIAFAPMMKRWRRTAVQVVRLPPPLRNTEVLDVNGCGSGHRQYVDRR